MAPSPEEIYKLYVENLIKELVLYLYKNPLSIRRLNKRDKIYFSFLVFYFSTSERLELMKEEISKIQQSMIKRTSAFIYNRVRGIANYAGTVAENALKKFIAEQLGTLATYDDGEISTFFPEIKLKSYLEYEERNVSFKEIEKVSELILKLTKYKPSIIIDSVDEDERIQNDEDIIAKFTERLLSNTKLLRYQGLHQVFFIWSTPYRLVKESVRQNKFYSPEIKWDNQHLLQLLNRRLSSYSKNKDMRINDIMDMDESMLFEFFNIHIIGI